MNRNVLINRPDFLNNTLIVLWVSTIGIGNRLLNLPGKWVASYGFFGLNA